MRRFHSFALVLSLVLSTSLSTASDTPDSVTWSSPQSGSTFGPGSTIVAAWQTPDAIVSPSFALCVGSDDGDDCGASMWPSVVQSPSANDSFTMSIIAPNVTAQESFFIKMKSDLGDYYSSPVFNLSPTAPNITANASSMALPTVTSSALPSITAPPVNLNAAPKTNPLAIGIPLTMLAMALIGALAFCLTRNQRVQRDSGGGASASLGPSSSAGLVPIHSRSSAMSKGGKLESGEATFFNISLNKTTTEMSEVEKAVCGAIRDGAQAGRPIPAPLPDRRQASPVRPVANARRFHPPDDEIYTALPPRTWQRGEMDGYSSKDRAWVAERQRRRAQEREYDRQWETERREQARRRHHPDDSPFDDRYEEDPPRSYSAHSAPEFRRHSNYEDESWKRRPESARPYEPQRRPYSSDYGARRDPPSFYEESRRGPNGYDAPPWRTLTRPHSTRPDPSHPREFAASAMASDQEHHSSMSVISGYLEPSPYISTASGFPTSPYMRSSSPPLADLPPSLRAGGDSSSYGPRYPPGLDSMRHGSGDRRAHPRFEFEDRQASQFRFTRMGSGSSSGRRQHDMRYMEKPLPIRPR